MVERSKSFSNSYKISGGHPTKLEMSHKKFSSTRSLNCREDFVVNNGDGSNSAAAKTGASNNLLKRNSFGSAPVKRQHTIRGKILLPILSYVKCFFSLVLIFWIIGAAVLTYRIDSNRASSY